MDLRQLRYFVALYEEAHVGRAAERLCLSQPALSQQMRHLQEDLQVELFQRQGRGLSPTLAAHSLYGHARELLRAAERTREALQVFRGQASQTLALGVLQTVNASLVPALLERLQQRQPHWLVQRWRAGLYRTGDCRRSGPVPDRRGFRTDLPQCRGERHRLHRRGAPCHRALWRACSRGAGGAATGDRAPFRRDRQSGLNGARRCVVHRIKCYLISSYLRFIYKHFRLI